MTCFKIEGILFNNSYVIPKITPFKNSIAVNPGQLKILEGVYSMNAAPEARFTITSELGQVYAQLTGQPRFEVYAESDLDFFYTVVEARIKFIKDESGAINKMILFQNGVEIEATRNKD